MRWARPRLVVSRCLGFAACRYDGKQLSSDWLERLAPFVDFESVCPEEAIGLGTPRDPIRVVVEGGERRLIQASTDRDLTRDMRNYARGFFGALGDVDGFVLKNKSPSCALSDTKIYASREPQAPIARGPGLFAEELRTHFATTPAVDEGQLTGFAPREAFLSAIFALAELRHIVETGGARELIDFHASLKLLGLAFEQTIIRRLGRLVADNAQAFGQDSAARTRIGAEYHAGIRELFAGRPKPGGYVDAMQHALGHVSPKITSTERQHLVQSIAEYRAGHVSLSTPLGLLRSLALRFETEWLLGQRLFSAYPRELLSAT